MSICRISKKQDFASIDKRILADTRLSWKAKGILAYLLGHPDDWVVRTKDLERRSTDGRDAVLSGLKELRELGYASFSTIRKQGKIVGKVYEIRDVPETGFPDQAKPTQENPSYTKNKGSLPRAKAPRLDFGLEVSHGPLKLSKAIKIWNKFSIEMGYHIHPGGMPTKGAQRGGWSRQTLQRWEREYKWLRQKYDKDKILSTLRWFLEHHNDEFVPVAHSFSTFVKKFESIDRGRRRDFKRRGGEDNEKANPKGYWENGKFIPSEED